jgi:hypothetical protein
MLITDRARRVPIPKNSGKDILTICKLYNKLIKGGLFASDILLQDGYNLSVYTGS